MKAIKIRGRLHLISRRAMSGYRTFCGKTASFGHQVYELKLEEINCPICAAEKCQEEFENCPTTIDYDNDCAP